MMAKGILGFYFVVCQLMSSGEAKQFCACIRLNGDHLDVLYCKRCDYEQPEPDDYRRYTENLVHAPPRPPGHAPHNNSLVNAVKNTLQRRAINYKRRNSFPGSCHQNDQFVFNDNGQMCQVLSDIFNSNQKVDDSTTYLQTTTTRDVITNPDTGDKTNGSGGSQSNDDPKSEGRRNGSKGNDSGEGVSAGAVVAIAILCFILGLLTMWLILNYCVALVGRGLRHRKKLYKTKPPMQNIQDANENTNAAEPISADRVPVLPSQDTHRTSYEGLRPENRISSVYNAIDHDYQTTEHNSTLPAVQGTAEYFVLEKENQENIDTSPNYNWVDNNSNTAQTNADYFVLEKNAGVYLSDNGRTQMDENKETSASNTPHNYFVLEQPNCINDGNVNDGQKVEKSGETTNAYFVLEKDENAAI